MASNPFFDFRVSPYRFAPLTLARAASINARLDEVTDGFDAVKAAVDLKSPSASPIFTGTATFNTAAVNITAGTVTAPSPGPVTDDSTKVPTTGWVHDLVGSLSVGLPLQTGNAGRFLRSDGTTASWHLMLALGMDGFVEYSASATHTGPERVIHLTSGIAAGTILTLPDARTLQLYEKFWVSSSSGVSHGVAGNAGELIYPLSNSGLVLMLTDNTTQDGVWRQCSGSSWTLQPITSMLQVWGATTTLRASKTQQTTAQINDEQFLSVSASASASSIEAYVTTVSGLSIAVGTPVTIGTDAAFQMYLEPVTDGFLLVYTTAQNGDLKAVGLTVSGTTVTAGSPVTLASSITAFLSRHPTGVNVGYRELSLAASGATALVSYRKGNDRQVIAMTVSGTTVTAGAAATLYTTASAPTNFEEIRLLAMSGSSFVASWCLDVSAETRVCMVSVSGTTATVNTSLAVESAYRFSAVARVSDTVLLHARDGRGTAAPPKFCLLTITGGTTLSKGSDFTPTGTYVPDGPIHLAEDGSGYFLVISTAHDASANARLIGLGVSGSTISAHGSVLTFSSSSGTPTAYQPKPLNGGVAVGTTGSSAWLVYDVSSGSLALRGGSLTPAVNSTYDRCPWASPLFKMPGKRYINFGTSQANAAAVIYGGGGVT